MPVLGVDAVENFFRSVTFFSYKVLPKKLNSHKNIYISKTLVEKKDYNYIEPINVILIIGESLRAKSLHILGYEHNTTPQLEKRNVYAKKIFSAGTMTKVSVSMLVNRVKSPLEISKVFSKEENIFKLAKEHNFTTYFYSNQTRKQVQILKSFLGLNYIDNFKTKEGLKKIIGKKTHYDKRLVKILKKIDLNSNKRNFIVLQMRGSHEVYSKQYSKKFNVFKHPYDNTVLYTDYILSKLIDIAKKNHITKHI